MRVYELSKQLELSNKDAVDILRDNGFEVASHMSMLSDAAIDFLRNYIKTDSVVSGARPFTAEKKNDEQPANENDVNELNIPQQGTSSVLIAEPMMLSDLAAKINKPVPDIIVALLKRGLSYAKNQILPAAIVEQLAKSYGLDVVANTQTEAEKNKKVITHAADRGHERAPIVVVIGHVDHGKTTLLDYIRKTRVASREKGGITQHLGAYEVGTSHGTIVFLDTPGHEAFTKMRGRGVRVADIAILVVAADDGVKPQTIEAIKQASSVQIPIVVALNKIDKVSPAQIESAKRGLMQYGLMPEEWGGQTIFVPISAKVGTGVNQLLELIALQAQLMELRAAYEGQARGFVLEAKIEKGFGSVATVICQEGTLKLGDYFVSGSATGKVSSLIDSSGQRLKEIKPGIPVRVSGFEQLPDAGDFFKVISFEEYKKARNQVKNRSASSDQKYSSSQEKVIRIIVKADNNSSKEAILGAIDKIAAKEESIPTQVVLSGVGDVSESDVVLAANTGAILYGFHVKADPKATAEAQRHNVSIRFFQIIYQLIDDIELVAKKEPTISYIKTKVGEASVLCSFKIKNMGIIAGAKIVEGKFVKDGRVIIKRGRYKVGEGAIKSLEREKKAVKEVQTGFECAFLVDGFEDWQVDDRVECWVEVPSSAKNT